MSDRSARNPHLDFKAAEAARPRFDEVSRFRFTQTVDPAWAFGDGANRLGRGRGRGGEPAKRVEHVAVDPHAPGRPAALNYKLLISGVVPRPIAFVSTCSGDGATTKLAPFSYFKVVNDDPPLFVVGVASPAAADAGAKDTLRNLVASREAVLNIVSESFVEAANATSVDAPYGCSEWPLSGLTPLYDCHTVRCPRVAEAVFSIEVKLDMLKEYDSRARPGSKSGTLIVLEGTRFWVRGDAVNDDRSLVDPAVLRPISRLGGITYARTTEALELTRPKFDGHQGGKQAFEKLNKTQPS